MTDTAISSTLATMDSAPPPPALPLHDIQANAFPGLKHPDPAFLFVEFASGPEGARDRLRDLPPFIGKANGAKVQEINARFKQLRENPARKDLAKLVAAD